MIEYKVHKLNQQVACNNRRLLNSCNSRHTYDDCSSIQYVDHKVHTTHYKFIVCKVVCVNCPAKLLFHSRLSQNPSMCMLLIMRWYGQSKHNRNLYKHLIHVIKNYVLWYSCPTGQYSAKYMLFLFL